LQGSRERRAKRTGVEIQSTKNEVPSTKYQVPSTKYQVPSTKYQVLYSRRDVEMKYIWLIVSITIVLVLWYGVRFAGCSRNVSGETVTFIEPQDSNFVPVRVQRYRPSSLSFSKKTSGVRLPKGVKERNVRQVVSLELQPDAVNGDSLSFKRQYRGLSHKIDIIETKSGEIFVLKDSLLTGVSVTRFEPRLFSLGLRFGIGCSIAQAENERLRILPMGIISFVDWNIGDVNFHAPIITADYEGVGIGMQTQLYHDIYFGLVRNWNYKGGEGMKAEVGFVF